MRSPTEARPNIPASRHEAARRSFLSEPLALHLLAVLLLLLVLLLRHQPVALAAEPINDESIYFDAFERVARGASPFGRSGYLTFSLLAHLGAWSLDTVGAAGTLILLRLANYAGAAIAVWCAAGFVARDWWLRLAAAALYLALAPAVAFGVFVGNLSLAVSGMIVVALVVWTRRPVVAGLLLGTSVVAKPLAPGAIVALAARRGDAGERRHLIAAGLAAAIALAVIALSPGLDRVVAIDPFPRLARSVSPHRLLHLLGWSGGVIWLSLAIALAVAFVARRRRLDVVHTMALATTAAVATTPLVWSHTLLVTLPLQAICLDIAWRRYRERAGGRTRRPLAVELIGVALAVAAIQLAEGATNIYDQPLWIQWLGALPPIAAPAALTAYLWHRAAPPAQRSPEPDRGIG